MRVLIVDQCSGSKSHPDSAPVYDVEEIDERGLDGIRDDPSSVTLPASDLYAGRQQNYVDEGVETLRRNGHDVDRYYISAGFGLVSEDTELPPYEATFKEMNTATVTERSERFGLTEELSELIAATEPYDVVFLTLGGDYYDAIDLESILSDLPDRSTAVLFNLEGTAAKFDGVVSLDARTEEAKRHGTIVVALKGQYIKNFASRVDNSGIDSTDTEEISRLCTSTESEQSGFSDF